MTLPDFTVNVHISFIANYHDIHKFYKKKNRNERESVEHVLLQGNLVKVYGSHLVRKYPAH